MPTFYEPPPTPDPPPSRYPTPIPRGPTPPPNKQPWVVDPQHYAAVTLAVDHDEALWTWGEYTMFVLMWGPRDFEAGLVNRCPTCFTAYGKIADTYQQSPKERCPDCYGTTFQGGWRAKVVRPSLFAPVEVDDSYRARGVVAEASTSLETTTDFTLHHNDYVFRGDGTRWQFQRPDFEDALTGFEVVERGAGWNVGAVVKEDDGSVAFMIPPSTSELVALLGRSYIRRPLDFSEVDEVRGPL